MQKQELDQLLYEPLREITRGLILEMSLKFISLLTQSDISNQYTVLRVSWRPLFDIIST